jgi:hypothetical protein
MPTCSYKDACFMMAKTMESLKATNFEPSKWVYVRTDECFSATYPSAFVQKYMDWYFIFAEHHHPVVFHMDDIESLYEFRVTKEFHKDGTCTKIDGD